MSRKNNRNFLLDNYPVNSVLTWENNSVAPIRISFYNGGVIKEFKDICPFNDAMDEYLPYSWNLDELVKNTNVIKKHAIMERRVKNNFSQRFAYKGINC